MSMMRDRESCTWTNDTLHNDNDGTEIELLLLIHFNEREEASIVITCYRIQSIDFNHRCTAGNIALETIMKIECFRK